MFPAAEALPTLSGSQFLALLLLVTNQLRNNEKISGLWSSIATVSARLLRHSSLQTALKRNESARKVWILRDGRQLS